MRKHTITGAGLVLPGLALSAWMALTGCAGGTQAAGPAQAGPSSPAPPAASGPAGPAGQTLSGIHACSLVPASVVAQALGALVQPPFGGHGLECFYNTAVPGGAGPSYILTVVTSSGYKAAKAFAMGEAQAGTVRLATVSGLGDDAYAISSDSGAPAYTLSALAGGVGVSVYVNDLGPAEAKTRELVAAALTHL
jgi:hypothetical protein